MRRTWEQQHLEFRLNDVWSSVLALCLTLLTKATSWLFQNKSSGFVASFPFCSFILGKFCVDLRLFDAKNEPRRQPLTSCSASGQKAEAELEPVHSAPNGTRKNSLISPSYFLFVLFLSASVSKHPASFLLSSFWKPDMFLSESC
uniref:Uncharacterized protein n=2 Tax=Nothobranchius pienaari TaxID=704102 RepID=A0A1A8MF83_9TELE